ncbi:hypothetical protein GmHk_07G019758 [Glycine max]|nr:hypothetical protein JHK87_018785 [Glycine soja]KAH1242416.1 hypothetical protein GmHk_07G019758 [Glycine max]
MSWFLAILFLGLTFGTTHSEASHDKRLPSAVVVGTVYCDSTCSQQDFSMGNHFISSAFPQLALFSKTVLLSCIFDSEDSSEPYYALASAAASSSRRLKSRKQGLHIFSAGFFSFKPLKQPNLCNQKPSIQNIKSKALIL